MEDEPAEYLEPGLHRFRARPWPPREARTLFAAREGEVIQGSFQHWISAGKDRFLFSVEAPTRGEASLILGPVGQSSEDWIRIPVAKGPVAILALELDGDPEPEFSVLFRDGTGLVLGRGRTRTDWRFRPSAQAGVSPVIHDPALDIARALAGMGLDSEASRAFSVAAGEASVDEVRCAALLGKADVTARQGDLRGAVKAYGEALRIPSARARAVPGKAWALERLGSWKELHTFLERELPSGNLPPDVFVRMEDLRRKVAPLAGLKPVVRLLEGGLNAAAQCGDPLAVRLGDGSVFIGGDGSRLNYLMVPVQWTGETFKIEADFDVEDLDWSTGIRFSLIGSPAEIEAGCLLATAKEARSAGVRIDPGYSTSFPVFQLQGASPWGGGRVSLIQKYPPRYPSRYQLVMEYSRELRFWRVTLRDRAGKILHDRTTEVTAPLPKGRYFLASLIARGGFKTFEPRWAVFRAGVTIHRLDLFGPWAGAFLPGVESTHAEDLLAWANGRLVAGHTQEAEDLYARVLSITAEESGDAGECIGNLPGWPAPEARARLYRGVAAFRRGAGAEGRRDLIKALEEDPFRTLFLLRHDLGLLEVEERGFLASCVLECALKSGGDWFKRFLSDVPGSGSSKPQREQWEAGFRKAVGDPDKLRVHLANMLLGLWGDLDFTHALFAGTPLEGQLRKFRLDDIATEAAGRKRGISDVSARRRFERFLRDHPADTRALNHFAWFLATVPRRKARDGARALALADRAVALRRKGNDALGLANALSTLSAARFEAGDALGAVEALEEAIRVCPSEHENLRSNLERRLGKLRSGR